MKNDILILLKETPLKFKIQFFFIFIFVTINAVLEVLSIGSLLPIIKIAESENFIFEINNFLPDSLNFSANLSKVELIKISCYFFLVIFFLKTLFSIFVIKYQTSVLANVKFRLSTFFFKVYSKNNYEFFKLNSSNKVLVDIDKNISEFANRFLFSSIFIISELIIISGFIIFLFILGERDFVFFIIILFFVLYLFNLLTKKKIDNASKIWQSLNIKKLKILQEFVRGVKEIKTKRNSYFFVNSFKKLSKEFENTFGNFNFLQLFPKHVFELLALSSLVFYLILTLDNQDLNTTISSFIIIFAIVLRLTPSISRINFHFSNIKFSITPFKKVVNLYENLSITRFKKNKFKISKQ
jgi:ABC-type multidrug transport system fused ATPase/permease subunit